MRAFRAFALVLVATSAVAVIASGKDKKKDTASEQKSDPANRSALSKQMAAVVEGNAKFKDKDFAAALEAYKRAVSLAPADPLGPYLVAEANLAQGNLDDAQASLDQAEKLGDKNADVASKVLFLQADVKERGKKWADAKAAWLRYKEWVDKHPGHGVAQTASARLQAIDDMMKQDAQYEDVRKRIADEKAGDGGKKSDGGK